MRLLRRLAYWWRFRAQQDDLREELELHRALLAEDLQRQGLAPDAAHAAARRAMGNETLTREDARGVWLAARLESFVKDWRYAWRGLRRSPAFTAVVTLTVALTLAATTVVFSVVQHILLEPLPFPDGNRIVRMGWESAADPQIQFGISGEIVRRLSAQSRALEEFAAATASQYRIGSDSELPSVAGASVTASFLPMLRVHPALGRAFMEDDVRPGALPVVILADGLWRSRFGGAREVVGQSVSVNDTPRTVIGVLPNGFDIPISPDDPPDLLLPLDLAAASNVGGAFARLRPGATSASASRELETITRGLPDTGSTKGLRLRASTARDRVDARDRRAIELLFVTVCGLLLVACANVANLLLMRAWSRQRELAIRLALGAGRGRVARQLLSESVLLALFGGALGLVFAWRALEVLVTVYPGGFLSGSVARLKIVHIDGAVLAWTVGVSVVTGLLFGVGPAFLSADTSLGDVLRSGGRTAVGSTAARRLRNALIVAEIAVSLVFLSAGALLVRSFVALARTPIGLDPAGLVTIEIKATHRVPPADRGALEQMIVSALREIPGVAGVAFGGGLAQTDVRAGPFAVEGPAGPQVVDLPFCEMPFVGTDYFHVARIALIRGRTFQGSDASVALGELVVNEALARRLWPNGNAVGSRLRIGDGSDATWLTVVGVAGDVHLPGTNGDLFNLQMYRPTSAAGRFVGNVIVRVSRRTPALEPAIRRALETAGVPAKLGQVWKTESVVDARALARPRFAVVVFGVFAIMALVVTAAGLYGVIAYAVTQRTREIGVRVALGAEPVAIARLVLGDSARLVIVGGALGLLGAYAGRRVLSSVLYQVSPTDPRALGGAVVLLAIVALIATVVPVRRALRIDPMDALRTD